MRNLIVTIPHQLTRAEVKHRIDEQVETLRRQQSGHLADVHTSWTQDTLRFSAKTLGQHVNGQLTVDDLAVHLSVALPWMVGFLAGTIKGRIDQEVRKLLRTAETRAT